MASQVPVIGAWYEDASQDDIFEVVALDEHSGSIEIQHVGGEVSEIDFETWQQLILLPAEQPEDWRASYELSNEDSHFPDDIFIPDNWNDPLTDIDADTVYGLDDF
ncbi:MAG: DUF6763 family protein [Porticoccus sp.]|jgi:uncharacterized protein DUF6763|uniref:DUF6763 family protein n=1 Tax=Porticoccus TaxID=1123967 RepID=UPI00056BBE36|nr:DUF6763 family protein [Porticoccus hydrocarbonoclasticus]MBG57032.1 hypothetical protein [Porticoccus sp.]|tara:strand:+ start:585 stop:902 length:318 start_codon:yes stop_codon:yes gene_type:complete